MDRQHGKVIGPFYVKSKHTPFVCRNVFAFKLYPWDGELVKRLALSKNNGDCDAVRIKELRKNKNEIDGSLLFYVYSLCHMCVIEFINLLFLI